MMFKIWREEDRPGKQWHLFMRSEGLPDRDEYFYSKEEAERYASKVAKAYL